MEAKKRAICPRCQRALRACICSIVRSVANDTEVLIVQHPQESGHIKNSARLLHLCLSQSHLICEEKFDDATWAALLAEKQSVLLYPTTPSMNAPVFSPDHIIDTSKVRLVVIDASWRHSRQILAQSPQLQALPRMALPDDVIANYQPRYHIRRAHQSHQLSSLEAAVLALQQWEDPTKFAPLLEAFEDFNAMQIAFGVQNLQRQ